MDKLRDDEYVSINTSSAIELPDYNNNQNEHEIVPLPTIMPSSKPMEKKKVRAEKKTYSTRSKQTQCIVSIINSK